MAEHFCFSMQLNPHKTKAFGGCHMTASVQTDAKTQISKLNVLLNGTNWMKAHIYAHNGSCAFRRLHNSRPGEDNSGQKKKQKKLAAGWGGQRGNTRKQIPQISGDIISQFIIKKYLPYISTLVFRLGWFRGRPSDLRWVFLKTLVLMNLRKRLA